MALTDEIEALLAKTAAHCQKIGRPSVTLSYAQSLDGCIAVRRGEPLAISGPQSLTLTHQLRAAHDAILVGIGTVLADDPRLTVRLVDGKDPQPVVVDGRLRVPLNAYLLQNHPLSPWIATSQQADRGHQQALERVGARVLRLPADRNGRVDLVALLGCLWTMGINCLMVEGGTRIITGFLRERLVDLLVLTVSPMLVGGLHAVENLGDSIPTSFPRLSQAGYEWLGPDLILWGAIAWEEA